jgi:hypothetical protein
MRITAVVLTLLVATSTVHAGEHFSESHRKAAADLLVESGAKRNAVAAASATTDAMIRGNPMLAPYRDVILAWSSKVLTWENMKPRMVDLYASEFSEQELRDLSAFYRTPLGAKVLRVLPEIMQRGSAIGSDLALEHQAELERMIQKRAAELERSQPAR